MSSCSFKNEFVLKMDGLTCPQTETIVRVIYEINSSTESFLIKEQMYDSFLACLTFFFKLLVHFLLKNGIRIVF